MRLLSLMLLLGVVPAASAQTVMLPAEAVSVLLRRVAAFDSLPPVMTLGEVPAAQRPHVLLPPNARVLLTVTGERSVDVFVRTAMTPADVLVYYRQTLTGKGWTDPGGLSDPQHAGFVSPPPPGRLFDFCSPEGSLLTIAFAEHPDAYDLSVKYEAVSSFCASQAFRRERPPFPALVSPPNVKSTGGGGDTHATDCKPDGRCYFLSGETSNTFDLEGSVAALAAHYEAQLAQQGWQRVGGVADARYALSEWHLAESGGLAWAGELRISPQPAQGGFQAIFTLKSYPRAAP